MGRTIIGIDNGVTGGISILLSRDGISHIKTPVRKELSYTKAKKFISRIEVIPLERHLKMTLAGEDNPLCLMERPMLNPGRLTASISAMRALEATLIVLERLKIPYIYIDSKEWQKEMLPKGLKGSEQLKAAANDVAKRLFPQIKIYNADSLLIAEYGRRKYNG